jgi:hypothetical protein
MEPSPAYYEFVGVRSCQDVIHLYRLLWVSTVLNVLGLCMGIVTAAVLGAFKDMVSDIFQHGLATRPQAGAQCLTLVAPLMEEDMVFVRAPL